MVITALSKEVIASTTEHNDLKIGCSFTPNSMSRKVAPISTLPFNWIRLSQSVHHRFNWVQRQCIVLVRIS